MKINMKVIVNRNAMEILSDKDTTSIEHRGLLISEFVLILILCFALWIPCRKADGGLIVSGDGFSTSTTGDAEEMHTYTVVDGLIGPVVPVIFQDSSGGLWFGSEKGGVSQFDGRTFKQFRLEDNLSSGVTEQICEDRWGGIWFLTRLPAEREGVVSYFNGTNIEKVGIATCLITDSSGDIWTADNRGLTHYTSSSRVERANSVDKKPSSIKSTRYPLQGTVDATINVLFQSKDGAFWLGGSDAGSILILNFDPDSGAKFIPIHAITTNNTKNEVVDPTERPPVSASTDDIFAIHDIAQGPYGIEHLWFAGRNLLLRFDGETLYPILPNPQSRDQADAQTGDPNDIELYHDRFHSQIWFCSGGSVRWWDGNDLQNLYRNDSHELLMNQNISSNAREFFGTLKIQDALGNLWFTSSTGAHRYNPDRGLNEVYTVEDGLGSDNIQTIFEGTDGKIWFGHDNGVTVFNSQPAFVTFKTRSALGSNSVHKIYSLGIPWFSVPGGLALYERGYLYQQALHQEHVLSGIEVEKDVSPVKVSVESEGRPAEIVSFFQNRRWSWFINKSDETSTETLYIFFAREYRDFKRLSIRVKTENGRNSHPEVLISSAEDPYIAFGGWLFKPDSKGLKWLSPRGIRTFEFQESISFEDLPTIEHGPAAIIDIHTDKNGKIWCYLADGTIQSYPNLSKEDISEVVQPEVVPMTHIVPLRLPNPSVKSDTSSDNVAPKWFFNSEEKRIIYWDIEQLMEPTAVEGVFNTPPVAIWERADASETTFIFSDHLKKYSGTRLIHEEMIRVAEVRAVLLTGTEVLWLATKEGAVQYDGTTLKNYGVKNGFLVSDLRDVHEDTWGHIWFATWGGGAVRYDGETFSPVTTEDGLAHNNVSDIYQGRHIWFATEGGITRYIPMDGALPFCNITAVEADGTYTNIPQTGLVLLSHAKDITFSFEGINPLRLRHHLTYEFKLLGLGTHDWTRGSTRTPTRFLPNRVTQTFATSTPTDTSMLREPSVTYQGLKPGNYTFLVKTYRKGWPYAARPAAVNFTIPSPVWTQWRSYLPPLIGIVLFVTIVTFLIARLIMNRHRKEAEMQRIRAELDEARNIQSGLLPTEAPQTEGLDVAGMSLPATQVGGDFYDYLNIDGKHLAIAVADASGKGLRGALNAVLTNGMLNEIAQVQYSADVILTNLNASLTPRLDARGFIALNLAIIDVEGKQMRYANAGQPYPILKRSETLIEIEMGELPLGSMRRVEYTQEKLELVPGDIFIFYTDGVIEALNSEQEMYGIERLKSVFAELPEHLSAEEIITHIFGDIQAFVHMAEQYDDITIVVVKHQPTTQ